MSLFKDPPQRIVENGEVAIGIFKEPVPEINAMDYLLLDEMDRVVSGIQKRFRLHSFNYFGVVNDLLIIGLAVYDLGYLGGYFLYVYFRESDRLVELAVKNPFAAGVRFSKRTDTGEISFRSGKTEVVIEQLIPDGIRRVKVSSRKVKLNFVMEDDYKKFSPLSICTRNSYSGWTYTQKKAGAPVREGSLEYEGKRYDLTGARSIFDWTSGFLRRDTYWLWAAGVGRAGEKEFGFNFSNGVNETVFTENVFWIDGKMHLVNYLQIDYDRKDPSKEWKVFSHDGKIDLTFKPAGSRSEKLNLRLIKSNFTQFFGSFSGVITLDDGSSLKVSASGFTEKHFAKW